jgi:glycosyltransferase involved in cell wall biosynthesis
MNAVGQVAVPRPVDAAAIARDPALTLLLPEDDVEDPELSIVVPALDEEITIAEFVAWCKQGIAAADIRAEILIIDSSSDRTAEIAVAGGARVLKTPKRGLGRAYIDAMPYIRGKYIVMGDADCTYDFRDIRPFVEKFRAGADFVMGSRFKGSIEAGAMPPLHRYFGTPLTTWILNVMYRTNFSDIHCGMRGLTMDAFRRMELASQSWEYASEMVLKSAHLGLRFEEVPASFLKDKEGRFSHHARAGWTSPWKAGWINLRAMFVFGADFFLIGPGSLLLGLAFPLLCVLAFGPLKVGAFTLSINAMLAILIAGILGLQFVMMGAIAQTLYDRTGIKRRRWLTLFPYNRTTIGCFTAFVVGLLLALDFIVAFVGAGGKFDEGLIEANHRGVFGLFLIFASALIFTSMLVIQAIKIYVPDAPKAGMGRY